MIKFFVIAILSASAYGEIPRAYGVVAEKYGVPVEVFYSVILQESGESRNGTYHPWPWTLNVAHKAYRYRSKAEAKAALIEFMNYENRIAVGLGQIYLPAHGHKFSDPTALLNPRVNLEYAAQILSSEFDVTSRNGRPNWWVAAGRYHHPSKEEYAAPYRALVFMKCREISAQCTMYGDIL
ncbi:lytic transglycosylase domain-containing protein [Marinagarivorans cellulosilyticus]|uniref:Transglycosylase SLT domain-containing protein n=1 Tax=Marinagarivorans cellulosilyticus TaxID=2721545 RepID=A0AAN1WHL8_9GAMM|nr:lytic transglycosylase domain-containing protein [Marinagarivorans cellulosilyticus]BCD97765.1 hypothetical protein MARGE09_P1966 [Marinagarivorans cellulosilyticus]